MCCCISRCGAAHLHTHPAEAQWHCNSCKVHLPLFQARKECPQRQSCQRKAVFSLGSPEPLIFRERAFTPSHRFGHPTHARGAQQSLRLVMKQSHGLEEIPYCRPKDSKVLSVVRSRGTVALQTFSSHSFPSRLHVLLLNRFELCQQRGHLLGLCLCNGRASRHGDRYVTVATDRTDVSPRASC